MSDVNSLHRLDRAVAAGELDVSQVLANDIMQAAAVNQSES
jgi:hypothetical protein